MSVKGFIAGGCLGFALAGYGAKGLLDEAHAQHYESLSKIEEKTLQYHVTVADMVERDRVTQYIHRNDMLTLRLHQAIVQKTIKKEKEKYKVAD